MSFRTYFDVSGADASDVLAQVVRQQARVATALSNVGRVVAVISGKGGVGKSWITAQLAITLAQQGHAVGVVDADLQSPTVARLLRARGPLSVHDSVVEPAVGDHGVRVISSDLLLNDAQPLRWKGDRGAPHTWRGTAETGVLREFLGDLRWGTLDVLLIDMPPDASRLGELASLVPRLHGAIAITIPSGESERSVSRALQAARDAGVAVLGLIENMSGYVCRHCDTVGPLFDGDAGAMLGAAFGIPLLARMPFVPAGGAVPALPEALLSAVVPPGEGGTR